MPTNRQAHVHISIPADCLPLVAELVARLGGVMADAGAKASPAAPQPEAVQGGKTLRALRQRAGMTQQALADAIGLPQSHISEFEQNRRAVPYKHARKLAEALRLVPDRLPAADVEIPMITKETKEDGRRATEVPKVSYKNLRT
jgi:transcriptional regulator with XRE-family HTH domain